MKNVLPIISKECYQVNSHQIIDEKCFANNQQRRKQNLQFFQKYCVFVCACQNPTKGGVGFSWDFFSKVPPLVPDGFKTP